MTIRLVDTFNDRLVSSHRSLAAAGRAARKHYRAIRRANGGRSYIPLAPFDADGNNLSDAADYLIALNGGT